MEKIDRLGWAAGISVDVFGLKIGIRARDGFTLDRMLSRMPDGWVPFQSVLVDRLYSVVTPAKRRDRIRELCVLYGDHGRLSRTERIDELLEIFEADVDLYIASNSQNYLFIHAGAVRWKNHTILIAGRSQTGKTTLVSELLKHGAAYYSDDFALVDRRGYLRSYSRNLSIRNQNNGTTRVPPEKFGATYAEPAPLSMVLLTEYSENARWRPRRISRGEGVLGLLENTPSARQQPSFAMEVLSNALGNAEILHSPRGDKARMVQELFNYLERRSPNA